MSQLPVAPDAPARAPLRRADDGAMIAGVAQGLATHLGLSPNTVRLAFVILALFSGAGALAYGVLWVLVPRATNAALPAGLEAASRRGMRPAAARPARPDDVGADPQVRGQPLSHPGDHRAVVGAPEGRAYGRVGRDGKLAHGPSLTRRGTQGQPRGDIPGGVQGVT